MRQHTPGPITAVSQVERQRQARMLAASTCVLAALAGVLNVFADSLCALCSLRLATNSKLAAEPFWTIQRTHI